MNFRRTVNWLMVVILCVTANAGLVNALNFDSIDYWVGAGDNQAALVVDWKNDLDPGWRIWGYRWSGTEEFNLEEMLIDILKDDDRFFMFYNPDEFSFGKPVHGFGSRMGEDSFAVDPALDFDADGIFSGQVEDVVEDRIAVNPGDYWEEGWFSGFWSLWDGGDGQAPQWEENVDGISGTLVTAGSWHGFSWAPPWPDPALPPVPEPSTVILLGLAGTLVLSRRGMV